MCCELGPRSGTPLVADATEDAAASISRCAAAVLAMDEVVIDGKIPGPVTVTVIPEAGPAPPPEDPVLEPDDPITSIIFLKLVWTTILVWLKIN